MECGRKEKENKREKKEEEYREKKEEVIGAQAVFRTPTDLASI